MKKGLVISIALTLCSLAAEAQEEQRLTAEQVLAEMDSPTFVPTVKVGKVLHEGDSIQFMEMNNVYVYPQLTFKNKKQAQSYMRLVTNVKKVLPIAKEARMMLIETTEYLETLPNDKAKAEHMKRVDIPTGLSVIFLKKVVFHLLRSMEALDLLQTASFQSQPSGLLLSIKNLLKATTNAFSAHQNVS